MPTTHTFGARTIPEGEVVFGPANIPRNDTMFRATFDATQHLNPGVTLTLTVEYSFDNGATWVFVTSAGRAGGVVFGDGGVVENTMSIATDIPDPTNTRRQIRCTVAVVGGTFSTAGGSVALT